MKNHNIYFSSIGNHVISHLALEIKIPLVCEGKKKRKLIRGRLDQIESNFVKGLK